jgi:hypothetical protein
MSEKYALNGVAKAEAFLKEPSPRLPLLQGFHLVGKHKQTLTLIEVFASKVDVIKFLSCLTLFNRVSIHIKNGEETTEMTRQLLDWAKREEWWNVHLLTIGVPCFTLRFIQWINSYCKALCRQCAMCAWR